MDLSPIQRIAAVANHAVRAAPAVPAAAPTAAVKATAQAAAAAADDQSTHRRPDTPTMRILVSWHPGSLGYVTQVVDQHTGSVLYQTPPDQVLAMVQQVMQRLGGGAR